MVENYPGNSHKTRAPAEEQIEPKKVEKIVTGEVSRRKKPLGKRFAETFVGGDASSVMEYVVFEVLVPAAKDTIADAFSQGIERMIFGEARSSSRRTGARPSGNGGFVNYSRMSQSNNAKPRNGLDEFRGPSRRARANHDFGEIILATRIEADTVLERLGDLIEQYDEASVADLYGMLGITPEHTDAKWGWGSVADAKIERVREGYVLDLPKTEQLA